MNVLVIGGTRFVGYFLTWRLIAQGHQVTLLNRGTLPDPFGERVKRIHVDRTTPAFGAALKDLRFDATVDFAGYTAADARGLVEALGERAGHIVYISSGQVYLVRETMRWPAQESDYDGPLMPRPSDPADVGDWEYGIGKRESEDLLSASGLPVTRIRIPMVNGERDDRRRFETFLYRLLDGGPILLPDGGTAPTRHVYGRDVARAINDLLGRRETFGQAYNLSQKETPTSQELVQRVAAQLGVTPRILAVPRQTLVAHGLNPRLVSPFASKWMSFLDPTRAEQELGFRATPLETYLECIVASFLANPPAAPPPSYAQRAAELELAAALGT